ncbi:MAG: hypothetical protein K2X01_03030 [Cyanobacteria bacterium]|nr:hypothetical protein [Cyanobacteriota bacterium]
MTCIALATCSKHPHWVPDETPLLEGLQSLGIEPVSLIWDGGFPAPLDPIEACVIRTTWDYSERHSDFLVWANTINQNIPLWNSPRILAWNADKHYLQWFETQQLPVVPSFFIQPEELKQPSPVLEQLTLFCQQSAQWVLKPTVSASGNNTFVFNNFDLLYQTLQEYLGQNRTHNIAMMIQPFLPSIQTHGEISVIMIEGRFAHAVIKTPSTDEFRIQEHLGGQTRFISLSAEFISMSEALLSRTAAFLGEVPLYGRLDFMAKTELSKQTKQNSPSNNLKNNPSDWLLSEMELIEPSLYLSHHPETGKILAKAIQQRLKTKSPTKQPVA